MTELITFVQAVGVPAAIAILLIWHTGPKLDKLTIAVLALGTKIAICPFQQKPSNPEKEEQP